PAARRCARAPAGRAVAHRGRDRDPARGRPPGGGRVSTQVDGRVAPVQVEANQPADRFYRGGSRIAAFRGGTGSGTHVPEDWVASATTLFGEATLGLTRLPDGELLRDA